MTARTTGTNCTKASTILTSEDICRMKANTISLMHTNPVASVMKISMFFKSGFTSYVQENHLLHSPLSFVTALPTGHLPISDGCRATAKPTSDRSPKTSVLKVTSRQKILPLLPNYRIFSFRGLQVQKGERRERSLRTINTRRKKQTSVQAQFVLRSQKSTGSSQVGTK